MRKQQFFLFIDLISGFFVNLSAGYFFAIYATPSLLDKINALMASIVCFGAAYFFGKQK